MKKRTFLVVILLLQGLILMNFAEALVINKYLMTTEIPSQSCNPPTSTNSFSVDDERAYSWILYSGFTLGDRIDWEFYTPDDTLYDTYAVIPSPLSPADGCTWGWMIIAPLDVPTGSWHVDVYVNSAHVFTEYFAITQQNSCPIKAIYGENSIETEFLRSLRDNVLSQTHEGKELIKLYYQWSPVIVRAMEEDEQFKEIVKAMVDEILPMIEGGVE